MTPPKPLELSWRKRSRMQCYTIDTRSAYLTAADELAAVLTQEGAGCTHCYGSGKDTSYYGPGPVPPCPDCTDRTDPDSGRHGPNENRHDVLRALGGSLTELYPQYELWRFERLAKDGL